MVAVRSRKGMEIIKGHEANTRVTDLHYNSRDDSFTGSYTWENLSNCEL